MLEQRPEALRTGPVVMKPVLPRLDPPQASYSTERLFQMLSTVSQLHTPACGPSFCSLLRANRLQALRSPTCAPVNPPNVGIGPSPFTPAVISTFLAPTRRDVFLGFTCHHCPAPDPSTPCPGHGSGQTGLLLPDSKPSTCPRPHPPSSRPLLFLERALLAKHASRCRACSASTLRETRAVHPGQQPARQPSHSAAHASACSVLQAHAARAAQCLTGCFAHF